MPPKSFWLLPLVAGSAWFITLSVLLLYWIGKGRPRFPYQSNPYVAFISDIGAFRLHPFFIVGGFITGLSFAGTVICVHFARYHTRLYAIRDVRWKKILSVIASLFGLGAGVSLILLTVFDTVRQHESHLILLLTTFGTLAVSAMSTTVVWFDQTWRPSNFPGLRRWCLASNCIVALEICLGVLFLAFNWTSHMRTAGILEWIVTYVGCAYLLCFIGYLWVPEKAVKNSDERRPLLRTAS